MTTDKVSAIICVYKGEKYIAQAVESVLAQTYKNFEIVIVNDGSPDNSAERIKPYLASRQIRYIEQANLGVAAARNTGIRNSSGKIVTFLDQDDWWLPDKLALQTAYLADHPDEQLIHGYQLYARDDGRPVEFVDDWVANIHGDCFDALFQRNRVAILTVAVRRSCLDEVGLFDETISKADDYELWMRIAHRFRLGFIEKPLGTYRLHDANTSRDSFAMEVAELGAINAILRKFPDVYYKVGASRVRARLFDLNFHVGNWYMWRAQEHETARKYFREAVKQRPHHLAALGRLLWCSLTKSQRRAFTWYVDRAKAILGSPSK